MTLSSMELAALENRLKELLDVILPLSTEQSEELLQILVSVCESSISPSTSFKHLLNKAAVCHLSEELRDLLKRYHLTGYSFALAGNYLFEIDDFLQQVVKQSKIFEKLKLPLAPLEKIRHDFETKCSLIKLTEGRKLSSYLILVCQHYQHLASLRSTSWAAIDEKLRIASSNHNSDVVDCCYGDRLIVQKLWCEGNELRQLLFKEGLPFKLIDELEQLKITDLVNLNTSMFLPLSSPLTPHEKKLFKQLCDRASLTNTMGISSERSDDGKLSDTIEQTLRLIGEIQNDSLFQTSLVQKTEELRALLEPFEENWISGILDLEGLEGNKILERLNDIKIIMNTTKESMLTLQPKGSDEDVIANIGGQEALCGILLGMGDNELKLSQARLPFLQRPNFCPIFPTSSPTKTRKFTFKSQEKMNALKKFLKEGGHSFGIDLKVKAFGVDTSLPFSVEKKEEKEENVESSINKTFRLYHFHHFPMASYRIERDQMMLSMSALKQLETIKNIATALEFLRVYGSHISVGVNQLGGVLTHLIELNNIATQNEQNLSDIAETKMNAEASLGFLTYFQPGGHLKKNNTGNVESKSSSDSNQVMYNFEAQAYGPNIFHPKLFEEVLKANRSTWHVIDRDLSPESLIPVWDIVREQFPSSDFESAAGWLQKAWLRETQEIHTDLTVEARLKIKLKIEENEQNRHQLDPTEEKIKEHLKKIEHFDLEASEYDFKLIDWLRKFFEMITTMEYRQKQYPKLMDHTKNVWVTYISKQELVRRLLKGLFDSKRIFQEKFKQVRFLLRSFLNDQRLNEMADAGYPLDKDICDKLLLQNIDDDEEKSRPINYLGLYLAPVPVVNLDNLRDILSQELTMFKNCVDRDNFSSYDTNYLQHRFELILHEALRRDVRNNQQDDVPSKLHDDIEDLLAEKYYFQDNNVFQSPMSVDGLQELINDIRDLQEKQLELSGTDTSMEDLELSQQQFQPESEILETGETPDKKLKSIKLPNKKYQQPKQDKVKKKSYADLLIDRPFSHFIPKNKKFDDKSQEASVYYLMSCLRYRLNLKLPSLNEEQMSSADMLSKLFQSTSLDDNSANTEGSSSRSTSLGLYDTLSSLIDEFDGSGKAEIFRLLLERRSALPLFLPRSHEHYLKLVSRITKTMYDSTSIRLGERKKTLGRVAVVSCRNRNESQTSELLKQVFHIESLHRHDFMAGSITSERLTAEIAIGCLVQQQQGTDITENNNKFLELLVVHVVGEIEPMWPFLMDFVDYLVVEDSVDGQKRFHDTLQALISQDSPAMEPKRGISIWKPSAAIKQEELTQEILRNLTTQFNDHLCFEAPSGEIVGKILQLGVSSFFEKHGFSNSNSKSLGEITSLCQLGYRPLLYDTPIDIDSIVNNQASNFKEIRSKEFILQLKFREQAKHEEKKYENRLNDDLKRRDQREIDECIKQRKNDCKKLKNHPLLTLLIQLLKLEDNCVRVSALRQLAKSLTDRSELELRSQQKKIQKLYADYVEWTGKSQNSENEKMIDGIKLMLKKERAEFNESIVSVEHLWRELSHMYVAEPFTHRLLPALAAQYLLDGFSLELLDGDSNMINLDWITKVLQQISLKTNKNKQRVFVLSVIGVQSSGKSTLLNTMFGIQMRTSVGQCTRGVNMQLLAVEGRPEYDYILLLDTEGVRAPEYHGLPGSERRDNQMATLSILLADATIVVNPGENDAAIKDILPVVLMAYQGSKLAEENGGRLSTMMFFVYNRIDTTQKEKMGNIIQSLATSLEQAINTVNKLATRSDANSKSPFQNFRLDATEASKSDVRILGNIKKEFTPPNDVPDPAYGEALVEFREHIHKRVMSRDGSIGSWNSRSLEEFAAYIKTVIRCIGSANFTLNFRNVVERMTYDQLESEYRSCERSLAKKYRVSFEEIRKGMDKQRHFPSSNADQMETTYYEKALHNEVIVTENDLNLNVNEIVTKKGREEWKLSFEKRWKQYKEDQLRHWRNLLKHSHERIFKYEAQVESYKKKMRHDIGVYFSSKTTDEALKQLNNDQLQQKFNDMYENIVAQSEKSSPPINVEECVGNAFRNSQIILASQIEIFGKRDLEGKCDKIISDQTKGNDRSVINISGGGDEMKQVINSIFNHVVNTVLEDKVCYDDSIVDEVIAYTDEALRLKGQYIPTNSNKEEAFIYGKRLITKRLAEIQLKWESENSVLAELRKEINRHDMWQYFKDASTGLQQAKLFVSQMKRVLKNSLGEAFEEQMVCQTAIRIRQKQWLHDAKLLRKYLDLHLIQLLDQNKLNDVLELIRQPEKLYEEVMNKFIIGNVPKVHEEWLNFITLLTAQIKLAASLAFASRSDRAKRFVEELHRLCVETIQNKSLGKSLGIFCGDEYKECDNEEENELFEKTITSELTGVFSEVNPPLEETLMKKLGSKVRLHMKNQHDSAGKQPCVASCPGCRSLCFHELNHNTGIVRHDTIHQPQGIVGIIDKKSGELVYKTCNQMVMDDGRFTFKDLVGNYREFDNIFYDWMQPSIDEEWPLREYIMATYNEEIAKKYEKKPCGDIPASYKRDLHAIRNDIEIEIKSRGDGIF